MAIHQMTESELAPELEAIATAAFERLRAQTDGNPHGAEEGHRGVADAASRAIAAGLPLSAIAEAERTGHARARETMGTEVLRRVERAARRKRDTDTEYEHAVARAVRLGLAHRDVAAAAQVSHGTVRAISVRTATTPADGSPSTTSQAFGDAAAEQ
jgi:hypothetical protein